MANTAQDLINTALRKIGAIAAGDTPAAGETADALSDLNGLIDSLNADRLYIYEIAAASYALTGAQSYTIGPAGAFNAVRPQSIEDANIVDLTNPAQPVRTPLRIVEADDWASISVLAVPTPIPEVLFYQPGYPLGKIWLYGIPNTANQLELWTRQLLTAFASAGSAVSFPPGYYELLWSELAIRVAPDYGREVPQSVIKIAQDARLRVESANSLTPVMSADSALINMSSAGTFNWLTNRS